VAEALRLRCDRGTLEIHAPANVRDVALAPPAREGDATPAPDRDHVDDLLVRLASGDAP